MAQLYNTLSRQLNSARCEPALILSPSSRSLSGSVTTGARFYQRWHRARKRPRGTAMRVDNAAAAAAAAGAALERRSATKRVKGSFGKEDGEQWQGRPTANNNYNKPEKRTKRTQWRELCWRLLLLVRRRQMIRNQATAIDVGLLDAASRKDAQTPLYFLGTPTQAARTRQRFFQLVNERRWCLSRKQQCPFLRFVNEGNLANQWKYWKNPTKFHT